MNLVNIHTRTTEDPVLLIVDANLNVSGAVAIPFYSMFLFYLPLYCPSNCLYPYSDPNQEFRKKYCL